MKVTFKFNNQCIKVKTKVNNFNELLSQIRTNFDSLSNQKVKIECKDQDRDYVLIRNEDQFEYAMDFYSQDKLEFVLFRLQAYDCTKDHKESEFVNLNTINNRNEYEQYDYDINKMPISNSVVFPENNANRNSTDLLNNTNQNGAEHSNKKPTIQLTDIPCYKCDGTGTRKGDICNKCRGYKYLMFSKKLQAIDYIIEKRLEQIFSQFIQKEEEDTNIQQNEFRKSNINYNQNQSQNHNYNYNQNQNQNQNFQLSSKQNDDNQKNRRSVEKTNNKSEMIQCLICKLSLEDKDYFCCNICKNGYYCKECFCSQNNQLSQNCSHNMELVSNPRKKNIYSQLCMDNSAQFDNLQSQYLKEDEDDLKDSYELEQNNNNQQQEQTIYKVKVLEGPINPVDLKLDVQCVNVSVKLQNTGIQKWPIGLELVCIQSQQLNDQKDNDQQNFYLNDLNHKQGVPSLEPGEQHTVKIYLNNPKVIGEYSTKWRLQYRSNKDNQYLCFGEPIQIQIRIQDTNDDLNYMLNKSGIALQATGKTKKLIDIYCPENTTEQVIIDFVKEKGQDLPIYELVEQFNNFLKQSKTQ